MTTPSIIITPAPNPILPLQLEIFYIMDKQWAEENKAAEATNVAGGDEGNHANLNANGTGPFMVTSRQSGVKTVLEQKPELLGRAADQRHRRRSSPRLTRTQPASPR